MRCTLFNGIEFKMQTASGVQKGVKTILTERGKWDQRLNLKCKECNPDAKFACCARRLLSLEDDFQKQLGWLEETAASLNVLILFFPKFHCELNFIEMIWGYVKAHLRRICTFSFKDLEDQLPVMLRTGIPLNFFKKAYIHCLRYMDGYRQGYHGPLLDYAMKKYKGHRHIPSDRMLKLQEEYDRVLALKQEKYNYVNT